MKKQVNSSLKEANALLRKGDYKKSLILYERVLREYENSLEGYFRFNYELAKRKDDEAEKQKKIEIEDLKPKIPIVEFDDAKEAYVEYKLQRKINPTVKLIAFYLPQFHPIPENDRWWGKGFTEWSNVGMATPLYFGHHQPHCPIHFGYYDLRVSKVQEEQAALAKEYGIHGFSYYYYWFGGKTLLEQPLLQMLSNKKVDIPFCLTWANENWTRRWDGQEQDVLIAQKHSIGDAIDFLKRIIKYFKDERYIRIDNKPLLIVYRANIIPSIEKIALLWQEEIKTHGFEGLYLVSAQTFGIKSPEPFNFDASVEFPPHTVSSTDIRHEVDFLDSEFSGQIFSYDQAVDGVVRHSEPEYKLFRTAMLSWDNTARKPKSSHIFHGFTIRRYKQWLSSICNKVFSQPKYSEDEKLVFINAWNEWAEGTHLEPDRRYGYGYLQATYEVIENYDESITKLLYEQVVKKRNDVAVILHVHYREILPSVFEYLRNFGSIPFDLFVTATNPSVIAEIKLNYPNAFVKFVDNRGRDILPFIGILRDIIELNYDAVCKVHTKKSEYRGDGDKLRLRIFESLLSSPQKIQRIVADIKKKPDLGIIAPEDFLISHSDHNMTFDREIVNELAKRMGFEFESLQFVAGSMFWFRPAALKRLLYLEESIFPVESGLADGTPAHGVERLIVCAAVADGYSVQSC